MSARSLTIRHMAKAVRVTREGQVTDPAALGPNQMQLYSFYKPSLLAGDYVIEATQTVTANTPAGLQTLEIQNTRVNNNTEPQEFEVVVPRFSMDSNIINSYYPPDGHQDEGRILPHIVFNDPHFPWEIPAGVTMNLDGPTDPQTIPDPTGKGPGATIHRGMVPWIALVVFDPEELYLPALADITGLNIPGYSQDSDVATQNASGTFTMKVSEYFSRIPASSRINYQAGYNGDDTGYSEITSMDSAVNVIFPQKTLFNQIFATDGDTATHKTGIEAHKYLAHVRNINTIGFPDAGVEEQGFFSIVLSSRTGAYNITAPHTQVCHLVSIEHIDSTLGDWMNTPSSGGSDRIGLVSLFSWLYTALPPNPVNFIDTMLNLTRTQQMFRTDNNAISQIKNAISNDGSTKSQASAIMASRLTMGYTIARWRTQSGEETAAFNRGPLVPQPVTWPPANDLPDCSNTSQDYQILDPQTGLMDLSYSSAWQAGKLLAISDSVFSAALMRFRSQVHNYSAGVTQAMVNSMKSKAMLISSVEDAIASVQSKSAGQTSYPQRFRAPSNRVLAPGMKHPDILPTLLANVKETVSSNTSAGQDIYDEFNLDGPNNSDWAIIHSWLAEKLSLGGIPPQYLIPEPAFVPAESLRFFHIDDFWLDCLLDGALSVANHLDKDDDFVRREIKQVFNVYLRRIVPDAGYKPQVPSYGFIIRSKIIKTMPDLRITVDWVVPDALRAPVCRWTRWDDETLMCLLDRQPEELQTITLAQPAHQQRFSLGAALDATNLTFKLRQLYTSGAPPGEWPLSTKTIDPAIPNQWFNFQTRCMNLTKLAADVNRLLQFTSTNEGSYVDPIPNSCELGLVLNDPSYYFQIVPPVTAVVAPRDRQLYVRVPSQVAVMERTVTTATKLLQPAAVARAPLISIAQGRAAVQESTLVGIAPKPPHQKLLMQPAPVKTVTKTLSASSVTSKFTLAVYPDYKGTPTRYATTKYDPSDYIPTKNIYFFDLIFSIRKSISASTSNYKLLKITIDIPAATSVPNTKTEVLLTANYDGPGLRMLSNQRFIPFLFNSNDGKLHIELIPRSANDGYALTINDRKSEELGFRLAEANISPVLVTTPVTIVGQNLKQLRGLVLVTMTEWYSTNAAPAGEPVATTYNVVKFSTQDDV